MSKLKLLLGCLLCVLSLTGCWNSKDIQNMAYVTALGLDYQDGKYITYVQVLNFSNVAKTENSQIGNVIPVWIGRGEGKTVTESFNAIYATSQIRVFWGHVKAIVCTENILHRGDRMKEAYDMLNRYREIRYNILLYGTKEPLQDIFAQKSILNLSPLDTIMYTPAQIFSQRSYILPVYGFKLIAQYNEAGNPAMLPSLTIDKEGWREDYKVKSMLKINGAYFFRKQQMIGWLSESDLQGYRWLQRKLERSPIMIPNERNPSAAVVLLHPTAKIKPVFENGKPYYNIRLKIEAYLDELAKEIPEKEIEKQASKVVEQQIRYTYKKGLQIRSDVLKLDQSLYREYPDKWHELHQSREFILEEDSLKQIHVQVELLHTGKYKGRQN
ncbi:Ger(x)C family spore germination protein [Paenibacillus doosanensis]|uniref:Spore germination protein B3 n=1 Tax=Paenibacillus konkukensis TaxID=2020716 RepID=A0ABY4RH24_9BACL|nr:MULTISPECIES: Ger(x)C family spore germination protein [Paenibacillus]MCS7462310.1 Ger(x)C family spore germination protein [Paenibacillus doosanensis]UQZ80878.1 Spore germination protein B3 precursor [Paenibacillus konkukensis]